VMLRSPALPVAIPAIRAHGLPPRPYLFPVWPEGGLRSPGGGSEYYRQPAMLVKSLHRAGGLSPGSDRRRSVGAASPQQSLRRRAPAMEPENAPLAHGHSARCPGLTRLMARCGMRRRSAGLGDGRTHLPPGSKSACQWHGFMVGVIIRRKKKASADPQVVLIRTA
jgi:hypothetical protein